MSTESNHILTSFDDSLETLRQEVINMAGASSHALQNAFTGLLKRELDICSDVIIEDDQVDQAEKRIDEMAMEVLLRYNPLAQDLRFVLSSLSICRAVERIGDHAVNIAKRARKLMKIGEMPETHLLEPMFDAAVQQLKLAIEAYADIDGAKGRAIAEMDESLDKLHKKAAKALTQAIEERESGEVGYLHLLFVGRSLERIGDLATNIGEDVVFIESAEDIRHASAS